ncbi:MAG: VOC family protein [Thermodesulfobacteriota bacterium]|nr:VOC family protein [Thermodesulfobacteriota bacterium]
MPSISSAQPKKRAMHYACRPDKKAVRDAAALINSATQPLVIGSSGIAASFYNDTLDTHEGLHHLGFMVNDLESRIAACKKHRIEVIQRGQIRHKGITVDYAYLDTREPGETIFELIQTRLGPIPIKMSPISHCIASFLGI